MVLGPVLGEAMLSRRRVRVHKQDEEVSQQLP